MQRMLILTIFILIIFLSYFYIHNHDYNYMNNWANAHNYEIKEIEKTLFDNGPFYFRERNTRIYKVTLHNSKRISYFRFGAWFIPEQAWRD